MNIGEEIRRLHVEPLEWPASLPQPEIPKEQPVSVPVEVPVEEEVPA